MFLKLNDYREQIGRSKWEVTPVAGESLVSKLKSLNPKETLLVIPAGQSSHLDQVFTPHETNFIRNEFLSQGGRGYFNCGSAYWVSAKRIYKDLCTESPEERKILVKSTNLSVFEGIAEGPLCPFPGKKYRVGFFSDAVKVQSENRFCTIYLSGGGSFILEPSSQKTRVLVKYQHSELLRLGVPPEELKKRENATLMVSVGEGAAIVSMYHPYYGPNDIDVERYEKFFGDCGTNWKFVKMSLSSEQDRMQFVLNAVLLPLENLEWKERASCVT
jgi:glutamine amidotransferase-like uncharacterized protein